MTKILFLVLVLAFPFKSLANPQCNEQQLKMIAAACGDSLTACGVRGINNLLAGRPTAQAILDMCTAQGPIGRQEDPMYLFECATNAVKYSPDPAMKLIANKCSARKSESLMDKIRTKSSNYERCLRQELQSMSARQRNSYGSAVR